MSSVAILGKMIHASDNRTSAPDTDTLQETTQAASNFKYRVLFRRLPLAVCHGGGEAELLLSL